MSFVFHGSLDNPKSVGTNKLIKEFAKIANSPEDIVSNYEFLRKTGKVKKVSNQTEAFGGFSKEDLNQVEELDEMAKEYREIYKVISENPIHIEDIVRLSHMNLKEVISKLTLLEIEGKIKKIAGNRYIRLHS